MSEDNPQNDVPSGDAPKAGGNGEKPDGYVGLDSYRKAVDEAKSAKRRAQELQAKVNEFEQINKQTQEDKLLEEKRFSEVIDQLKQENQDLKGQVDTHVCAGKIHVVAPGHALYGYVRGIDHPGPRN